MKTEVKSEFHNCTEFPESTVSWSTSGTFRTLSDIRGFTLVELLMVSGVLAVLVAIAIPTWPYYKNLAKTSRAMSEIRTIETGISAFYADRGVLPPFVAGDILPAELSNVGFDSAVDPWGNPYKYQAAGNRTYVTPVNTDYDLYSEGADGTHLPSLVDSPDDIIRTREGANVDLAKKYGL